MAVLGIAGPGAEIICGILVSKSLSVFACFPVISFQFFSDARPLLGYQKRRTWGHGKLAPRPPKASTASTQGKVTDPIVESLMIYFVIITLLVSCIVIMQQRDFGVAYVLYIQTYLHIFICMCMYVYMAGLFVKKL